MKIAGAKLPITISEISPSDLNNWSGTPHYVYKILSENHTVVWIGEGMCNGIY